jgi:hypothetical protein
MGDVVSALANEKLANAIRSTPAVAFIALTAYLE